MQPIIAATLFIICIALALAAEQSVARDDFWHIEPPTEYNCGG